MTLQILWGSIVLTICSIVHLALIVVWVGILKRHALHKADTSSVLNLVFPVCGTFALLVFSHTIQVWVWAAFLLTLSALPNMFDAIYFSLVTYTTLGYGDVTLASDFKIFGAMAAVTGLLNFGLSTAFLVAVISKALPNHLGND